MRSSGGSTEVRGDSRKLCWAQSVWQSVRLYLTARYCKPPSAAAPAPGAGRGSQVEQLTMLYKSSDGASVCPDSIKMIDYSSLSPHTASRRSDSLSSDYSSRNRASPTFNILEKVGRTPFHRFSKKQALGPHDNEDVNDDLYAPDLLELDEFENNERENANCLHFISSPLTHEDDHEILSSGNKQGILLLLKGKNQTVQTSSQDLYQEKIRSLVLSSDFSMRTFCKRVYLHPRHAKRRKENKTKDGRRFTSFVCNQCEKIVPVRAWIEPSRINPTMIHQKSFLIHDEFLTHVDNNTRGIIPVDEEEEETETREPLVSDIRHRHHIIVDSKDEPFCTCTYSPDTESPTIPSDPILPSSSTFLNHLFDYVYNTLWQNEPLSIALDASDHSLRLYFRVHKAGWVLILSCVHTSIDHTTHTLCHVRDQAFSWTHPLFSFLGRHMGRTGEVIVTGIQSVKSHGSVSTGLGSSKLSAGVMNVGKEAISRVNTFLGLGSSNAMKDSAAVVNEKMIRKMSKIDSAAKVVSYHEMTDEALPLQTKQRVMRMMHYPVSLRPFMATISVTGMKDPSTNATLSHMETSYQSCDDVCAMDDNQSVSSTSSSSDSNNNELSNTPFMCTPKSFPPTPSSRANVLAKSSRLSEDVIFLARDLLRLEEGLGSSNIHTKSMAKALRDSRKLAVFNPSDASGGISLTRGRHCASKIGNDLYASVRGMIPVPRNCHVYFEMSVSTPAFLTVMLHHASLSLGLSTLQMPLNALVGAWKSSVGLCSTSQILIASQWFSPLYPRPYSGSSTVGCLVILDDQTVVDTWDGVMVTAKIVFNVDGNLVIPATHNHLSQSPNLYSLSSSQNCHDALKLRNDSTNVDNEMNPVISMLVPKGEQLYPTLTLHSSNTDVLCRFSSSDVVAKSRHRIGAPTGVTVYGIDGSILFPDDLDIDDEDEDDGISDDDHDDLSVASEKTPLS